MQKLRLANRLTMYARHFTREEHAKALREAIRLFFRGKYDESEKAMSPLPTQDQLMETLLEKVKGKPVYKTLRLIMENKSQDVNTELKALFSLGTHAAIECEQGNSEYGVLLPLIYEKLGTLIFGSFD